MNNGAVCGYVQLLVRSFIMEYTNKELRNVGLQIGIGIIHAMTFLAVGVSMVYLAINLMNIGVDDSDFSGKDRSGLRIHTDAKTGIQYLSAPQGGIIKR